MTNEEIIQNYASKGTQVPETFVSNARKQYENYKKMKLELDISEKEFRNSSKKVVDPKEVEGMETENKKLTTKLYK